MFFSLFQERKLIHSMKGNSREETIDFTVSIGTFELQDLETF